MITLLTALSPLLIQIGLAWIRATSKTKADADAAAAEFLAAVKTKVEASEKSIALKQSYQQQLDGFQKADEAPVEPPPKA